MISAIILAGGKGKRMNSSVSKQFIELKGKPILYYTLKKFIDNENIDEIILVLPKDEIEYCKENILEKYSLKIAKIVEGGKERQDSVYNGLKSIIYQLNSDNFPRIRLGVDAPLREKADLADFVLGRFSKDEVPVLEEAIIKAKGAVEEIVAGNIDRAMNKYNG